ncbi:hypothetical protein BU14_1030s0001 [Porphyra umbilicalis]|uniref:ATP-dependent DNA helicase n=1 Tax=Porphyra umbilicalis TaxID=2786 RepID=A0A1X6NMN6_PORUM|nr:hypothetical protein BU14_1030s0001 [Porphyra umbilicalis]|eukprot:OSX69891.1 hypothetical protein BU14_1030s0001 [Porphyra umbilicalis]
MAFDSADGAASWVASAAQQRSLSLRVATSMRTTERAVRARAGRECRVFDVAHVADQDGLVALISMCKTTVFLKFFSTTEMARSVAPALRLPTGARPIRVGSDRASSGAVLTASSDQGASSRGAALSSPQRWGDSRSQSDAGAVLRVSAPITRRTRGIGAPSVGRAQGQRRSRLGQAQPRLPPSDPYAAYKQSVFVTGDAGAGKTTLLKTVKRHLVEMDPFMGMCATTGIAACCLGGLTLHSWLGLVPSAVVAAATGASPSDVAALLPVPARRRIRAARILVTDEISMLEATMLDAIDGLCRSFRSTPTSPMGGLTVLFCGDFVQLAPVAGQGVFKGSFSFHAVVWKALFGKRAVVLATAHRHGGDPSYLGLLRRLRRAELTEADVLALQSRVVDGVAPVDAVSLYATVEEARRHNQHRLGALGKRTITYVAENCCGRLSSDAARVVLDSLTPAPDSIVLCLNAAVLAVSNVYFHRHGVCSGCRGTVVGFQASGGAQEFKLPSGVLRRIVVSRTDFMAATVTGDAAGHSSSHSSSYNPVRRQLPLVLGWALTIHKAQGKKLELAYVTLSCVFTSSMVYVACSRVRSLSSLFLKTFDTSLVPVSREALSFHDELDHVPLM